MATQTAIQKNSAKPEKPVREKLKKAWAVATLNFKNLKLAYILPAALLGAMLINMIIFFIIPQGGDNSGIENDFFYGVILLAAILIPARNFKKSVTLNVKKKDYFLGALINYAILSLVITIITMVWYYAVAMPITKANNGFDQTFLALYRVFGFAGNGVIVGFLQHLGFLFFFSVFIHTLVSLQDKWVGWVADCIIIAMIPICTAIVPLRIVWKSIFYVTIFGHPAVQILFTLLGGLALYSLNLIILKKKNI